jgi:hypothetical protein
VTASPVTAAWALTAHALGAALMGLLEAARLGSTRLGLVLVPLFAATGLVAGVLIAGVGRLVRRWPRGLAALALAAPTLAVTIPIARTLFDGPYARTLPLAPALPFAAPAAAWLLAAGAIWVGARLAAGDPAARAIAILGVAGAIGGIVRAERSVLGTGYPDAQIGAAIGVLVLAGVFVRIAVRPRLSPYLAAAAAALVLGTAAASVTDGLAGPAIAACSPTAAITAAISCGSCARCSISIATAARRCSAAGTATIATPRATPARSTRPATGSIRTATAPTRSRRRRHRRRRRSIWTASAPRRRTAR